MQQLKALFTLAISCVYIKGGLNHYEIFRGV